MRDRDQQRCFRREISYLIGLLWKAHRDVKFADPIAPSRVPRSISDEKRPLQRESESNCLFVLFRIEKYVVFGKIFR